MPIRHTKLCAIYLFFAIPLICFAQEEEELARSYGDKAFVSIATGARQPLARAPAVASVITAKEIAAMGASDINEVLESVPGMHVGRYVSEYSPIYVVRGIFNAVNPQVLLLRNGVPLTTLLTGGRGVDVGDVPIDHIARIEVIRGPGSALYGADAYSAIINIITKTQHEVQGTQIGMRYGSFRSRDIWLEHGSKHGKLELVSYLRWGRTEGSREIIEVDAQSARDKLFGTRASLAPGPINRGYHALDGNLDLALDKWRWRAGYTLRTNSGTGAGVTATLDPVGKSAHETITSDLSWSDGQFAPNWGGGLVLSYMGYKQRIEEHLRLAPPGTRLPTGLFVEGQIGHPDTSERQIRASAYLTYTGFEFHKLRLGVGHDDLNMYATATLKNYLFNANGVPVPTGPVADYSQIQPFLLPQRRKLDYIYLQDEWQLAKDLSLTGGVRHDRYSDFGATTNPRLALVWKASYELTAKLLYGSAFRAPSFNESYSINNPVLRGNPKIQPETIKTLEAALNWQMRPDSQLSLNLFQYKMKDIIGAVANPAPAIGATYFNTGNQQGRGLEVEFSSDAISDWHINANYAYQRSTNQTTGLDAGYAPHHHFYLHANWRFKPGWQFGGQLNHVAKRLRPAGDTRPAIADYTSVDLTLRHSEAHSPWQISATIRNLFNADIREPSPAPGAIVHDLPMPKRNAYVQLAYQF